jgi:hypothetical protein
MCGDLLRVTRGQTVGISHGIAESYDWQAPHNRDGIDLMLTTSAPETVNPWRTRAKRPTARASRPWCRGRAWSFGRGAEESNEKAFRYTYHFSFGVETIESPYTTMWPRCRRTVRQSDGMHWPGLMGEHMCGLGADRGSRLSLQRLRLSS